jgi:hypothetical protein
MTNLIAHGDRFKLNLWLWTNTPIPARAWFEIACAKHEYGDFHMPTSYANSVMETRHAGADEHGRARVRITFIREWAGQHAIPLNEATCRCNAVVEPWAFPAPVYVMRANGRIFASTNFPLALTEQARIIPSGQPVARSSKYPALAVIYQVAST